MTRLFPATQYFRRVHDEQLPTESKQENIILTVKGMDTLAQYYKEKYAIDIIPFAVTMLPNAETAANTLCEYIHIKRSEGIDKEFYRCGFVLHNLFAGRHGHATPIIWEKYHEEEHLFFLDSSLFDIAEGYDESSRVRKRETGDIKQFRERIYTLCPQIKIWSSIGKRQIDYSSCTIDAMVILKDALRWEAPLKEHIVSRGCKKLQNIGLFQLPEYLLKTAQKSSFVLRDSSANLEQPMHVHHVKDSARNKTGITQSVTLQQFREKYDMPVLVKGEMRFFGTYTLHKGEKIAEILRKKWEIEHQDSSVVFDSPK